MSIGNGNIDAIFTKSLKLGDALAPTLALNYSLGQVNGEVPTVRQGNAHVTIDANGGAGDNFALISIAIERYDENGDALADIDWALSGVAAGGKVAWAGSDGAGWTGKAATLKEAIDMLEEIPGIQAFALHAPHSMSLGSDNFIDVAETDIETQPNEYTEVLYRDIDQFKVDSDLVAYLRVGLPELRDAGAMKLIGLVGTITGATNGKVRIYQDDIRSYGKEYNATYATEILNKQLYLDKTAVEGTLTDYIDDNILDAVTIQGPIIIEVQSDDVTATDLVLKLIQANT